MSQAAVWSLTWFSNETEEILGEVDLAIGDEDVRRMFSLGEGAIDFTGAFVVTAAQVPELERLSQTKIDLNAFAYFVECYAT